MITGYTFLPKFVALCSFSNLNGGYWTGSILIRSETKEKERHCSYLPDQIWNLPHQVRNFTRLLRVSWVTRKWVGLRLPSKRRRCKIRGQRIRSDWGSGEAGRERKGINWVWWSLELESGASIVCFLVESFWKSFGVRTWLIPSHVLLYLISGGHAESLRYPL